ncbi:hypothetical protein MJM59_33495, partial [Salmonella enterica subsp. enterica serovar Montevideo]|nr:hypothetical protein [Salmonella enterica subsp. enterica serovar Montevideo]
TVAQTALSYDDYRYLEKLSREVGSHFHALDRNTLYTANRDIRNHRGHQKFFYDRHRIFSFSHNPSFHFGGVLSPHSRLALSS